MARLNGVKTMDMVNGEITKVEYNGEVYAKVDGSAQKGDLVVAKPKGYSGDITTGAFYRYLKPAYIGDAIAFINDVGDEGRLPFGEYETFRKETTTSETYRLVTDRDPKVGDFVKFTDEDELPSYLTIGKYYEIEEIDFANDPQITDDDGDDFDAGGYEYDVYEKVSDKPLLKTEKRPAKVGERIIIISAEPLKPKQSYETGSIFTVSKVDYPCDGDVQVVGQSSFIDYKEYEVIVEHTETSQADTITHNGVKYKLVDRKAQPGDVVEYLDGFITEVTGYNGSGGLVGYNRSGEKVWAVYGIDHPVRVYAPIASAETLKEENTALRVGDYVKVISVCAGEYNTEIGDIVKLTRAWGDDYFYYEVLRNGKKSGMFTSRFVKATAEEVAEANVKIKFASINVGDYVKITDKLHGHRFEIGEIVKIAGKSSIDFTAEKLDGSTSWYVSVSEIEKIDANEAEKFAKWAKIGRKPNEFKKGDIVRLTEDSGANEEGEIVEIAEDGAHFYYDECGDKYGSEASWFELVSPVEARFDRQ
jgi:hypothetical protein